MDKAPKAPKIRICKCSHLREDHIRKNKFLKPMGECDKCPCTSYLKRERPTKYDKVASILTIVLLGVFSVLIGLFFYDIYEMLELNPEMYEEPADLTKGEFIELMALGLGIIAIFFILWILEMALDYRRILQRKDYNQYNRDFLKDETKKD